MEVEVSHSTKMWGNVTCQRLSAHRSILTNEAYGRCIEFQNILVISLSRDQWEATHLY